ncbi:MAG: hypothetical protein JST64_03720 [Actinobacteria bacterium]|nr:hypothetical protein [Actinomycetota bacterium]
MVSPEVDGEQSSDDVDFDEALRRFLDDGGHSDVPREPTHAERGRAARSADLRRRSTGVPVVSEPRS